MTFADQTSRPYEWRDADDDRRGSAESGIRRLLATGPSFAPTVLRVVLGGVMLPHAAQKTLGWFGGHGWHGTITGFTSHMHLSPTLAVFVIVTELAASIALLFGFLTRLAALGIAGVMIGAIALVHAKFGFFMNWFGQQHGEGFEYHLLALALCAGLFVLGGGRWSIDRALTGVRTRGAVRRH